MKRNFFILYKIYASQLGNVVVAKSKTVAEKAVCAAVNAVHFLKGGAKIVALGGEQQIERGGGVSAEGDDCNHKIYQPIFEADAAIGAHIVPHDLVALYAKRQQNCRAGNARSVLTLRAVPQNCALLAVVKQKADKIAESVKGGGFGYHNTVCIRKIAAGATVLRHDLFEYGAAVLFIYRGILLVVKGREVAIVHALCHNVGLFGKLGGTAKVNDGSESPFIPQLIGGAGLYGGKMTATVQHTCADALAVGGGNPAQISEISDFFRHFICLRKRFYVKGGGAPFSHLRVLHIITHISPFVQHFYYWIGGNIWI